MAVRRDDGPDDGRIIGGWILRRLLGQGGMGQVWKVYQNTEAGQPRWGVMKLPLASSVGDDSAMRRAATEVRVMMKLQGCPNVVQISDMGVDAGIFYFVMEYVHGTDLAEFARLLRRGRVRPGPGEVAWIAGEILTGLKSIHNLVIGGIPQELCHLDITMKNIFVSVKGEIKIGDFGISRGALDPSLTNRGTPRYMAPEHYIGFPNQKSDVFALGIVLWELFERESYRKGNDVNEIGAEITSHEVRPLRRADVSPELAKLIRDCLDPLDHRRPTATEALARLEKLAEYRMQRSRVSELMGHHFSGAGNSGQTELMDAMPAAVTPEFAGMRAAGRVLEEQGNAMGLKEVFAGLAKPGRAPGHVAIPPPADDDDAPLPPAMFAGSDGDDDPVPHESPRMHVVPVAPPVVIEPERARARTTPLGGIAGVAPGSATHKLSNDEQASVMGPPPAGPLGAVAPAGAAVGAASAVTAVPFAVPLAERSAANTPWPPRRRASAPTSPEPTSTTDPVRLLESSRSLATPSRVRQGLVLGLGAAVAVVAGVGVAAWLDGGGRDATAPIARVERADSGPVRERPVARAREAASQPTGPKLIAVGEPAAKPQPVAVAAWPLEPSPALEPPRVEPGTVEPAAVERAEVVPAEVVPAVVEPASSKPAAVSAKPKPEVGPPVKVEVRVEFVMPSADVKVGKKKVTTNASAFFELPAGRYPVQWRAVGTTEYNKGGTFVLRAGASHLIMIGKVGTPTGVRHVVQEPK